MKIPSPIITKNNLLIRPYGLKDAPALFALMKANRESLLHTFPQSLAGTSSLLKTRRYILQKRGDSQAGVLLVCGIFMMPEERLIGHILFTKFDWSVPKCEMGYLIDEGERGNGYATQSAQLFAQWGFDTLRMEKITMRIWPENHPSIALAKNLGAHEAGLAKRDFRTTDGRVLDCALFELYNKNSR